MLKLKVLTLLAICALFSLVASKAIPEEGYVMPTHFKILESFMDHPPKELFKVFHHVYNKSADYDLNSKEALKRYRIFKDNLNLIKTENEKEENTFRLGLTPFADLTNEEFREKYLMKVGDMKKTQQRFLENTIDFDNYFDKYADDDADDEETKTRARSDVNWNGYMGWARSQGSCGSCWSFSSAGAIQTVRRMKFGGDNINLSTQQFVDCVSSSKGCNGGWPAYALQYAMETGLVEESKYPYQGKDQTCNANAVQNNPKYKIQNYVSCGGDACTDDKWYELLSKGPVIVTIDGSSWKLQLYMFGVIYMSKSDCVAENHAVYAYGWARRNTFWNTDEYIRLRNSWGVTWGEFGNFNIAYKPDDNRSCFITNNGFLPVA